MDHCVLESCKADGLDVPFRPLPALRLGNTGDLETELDVLPDGPPREEGEVLEDHPPVRSGALAAFPSQGDRS
ncbi:hypothetical protein SDC9_188031 [bioreactor metagenome]|uniref:Uncharacterized protein n=1 Tax=bioreactor metagenome TaxID=1076179 RepID=A0A645HYX9_9ZZZZ